MDTTWCFAIRSVPRTASAAKLLAAFIGTAALAGIYPVATAIATAMAATLRTDESKVGAPIMVSAGAAERNSLGLRLVPRPASGTALPL
jgi:galactitol-specific phosphotransferase system IIC component